MQFVILKPFKWLNMCQSMTSSDTLHGDKQTQAASANTVNHCNQTWTNQPEYSSWLLAYAMQWPLYSRSIIQERPLFLSVCLSLRGAGHCSGGGGAAAEAGRAVSGASQVIYREESRPPWPLCLRLRFLFLFTWPTSAHSDCCPPCKHWWYFF